jgi:hypothetical protein
MDQKQVEVMRQNYASLSDDDLIHIFATRELTLTEEAKYALLETAHARNLTTFDAEVKATRQDLMDREKHELAQLEKQIALRRSIRSTLNMAFAVIVTGGLLMAIFLDTQTGMLMSAFGALAFVLSEMNRLLWRFVAALFHNESSE